MFIDDDKERSDILFLLLQPTQPSAILQASLPLLHFLESSSYTDFKFSALIFLRDKFLILMDLPEGAEGFINVGADYNKILRKVWNLPHRSHTSIVHCTADIPAICNIVYSRSCKFLSRSLLSYAPIVYSIIRESSSLVYTFLGYNLYGSHHLKFYSNYDFDISFFVRSVRLYYGFNSPFENFMW